MANNNWLQTKLESLRFWANQFNQLSKEGNNDGAFVAWETAQKIQKEILDFTGWTMGTLLGKY